MLSRWQRPGFRVVGPGVVAKLTGAGNDIGSPFTFTGSRIVSVDEAAMPNSPPAIPATVFDNERSSGFAVAAVMRRHFGVQRITGARIDRNEMGIKVDMKSVSPRMATPRLFRPQQIRSRQAFHDHNASTRVPASVDSDDVRGGFGDKHNAVNDQGDCFRPVNNGIWYAHFISMANVVGVNAVEQAVADCPVRVHQPVIGLIAGVYQSLPGYRRKCGSDYRRN